MLNLRLFFLLYQQFLSCEHFCNFSLNKGFKTYLKPMLPQVTFL
jgi:hypothetical protein